MIVVAAADEAVAVVAVVVDAVHGVFGVGMSGRFVVVAVVVRGRIAFGFFAGFDGVVAVFGAVAIPIGIAEPGEGVPRVFIGIAVAVVVFAVADLARVGEGVAR